jgi:8-oxo-dGTP diphosphatase
MPKSIQVGAGAIIILNGKTLLTKRKGAHGENTYGSFGGHVELGETPIQTVKREAFEELGIEVSNIQFLSCTNLSKYGEHFIDISFICDIAAGQPKIMEPSRIESLDWYPLNNLPSPLFEPVTIALKAYNSGIAYYEIND